MGRPEERIDRDGSPVREFAFWLRDLRNRSAITYEELAKKTNYATSTMQAAAAGGRLPTLPVTIAFVRACGGDVAAWQRYWSQIRRLLDPQVPPAMSRSVAPPWAERSPTGPVQSKDDAPGARNQHGKPYRPPPVNPGPAIVGQMGADTPGGWYSESCSALLRLDTEPIESLEQRVIVAAVDGLTELMTSISIPRHPDDPAQEHDLDVELLHGGFLEKREQPFESYFRHFITLPRPLRIGERHEYAMRLRIPPQQQMFPHYVQMPFRRTDYFEARVRFNLNRMPRKVWALDGAPPAVLYDRDLAQDILVPDRFGQVYVSFRDLKLGLSYGVCWQD